MPVDTIFRKMCTRPNLIVVYEDDLDKTQHKVLFFDKEKKYNSFITKTIDPFLDTGISWKGKKDQLIHYGHAIWRGYVPCGVCQECQMEYSRNWIARLEAENRESLNSYFLTLTYDDEHLPDDYQLKKKDLQNFLKRLRKYYFKHYELKDIRYFACGEYGSKRGRPHYHMIVFNLPINSDDFKLFNKESDHFEHMYYAGTGETGCKVYRNNTIEKIWKNGLVFIGNADIGSMSYVSRYCYKKKDRRLNDYQKQLIKQFDVQEEFILMSKKLGSKYIDENIDKILKNDGCINIKGKNYNLGRYLKKKCADSEYLEDIEKIQEKKRRLASISLSTNEFFRDNGRKKYYEYKENEAKEKKKLLKQTQY